jgi:hypothetical protein
MPKSINIYIPDDVNVPEIINSFTPEENYLMLKLGSDAINEAKNRVATLSQEEVYNKIEDEFRDKLKKLEIDLLVEREMKEHSNENITNIFETQLQKKEEQIKKLTNILNKYELDKNLLVQEELKRQKELTNIRIQEKENQINKLMEILDDIKANKSKTSAKIGTEGEKSFYEIAETFNDFHNFEIEDTHKRSNCGDFHLKFKDFTVLVDAKNHKEKVQSTDRDKLRKDLEKNAHIHFAWMVALNATIDKFDKMPIMVDWISTEQCIIYINNILQYEEPTKILRIAYLMCKEIYKFIKVKNSKEENELVELKENKYKTINKVQQLKNLIKELNTTIGTLKTQVNTMDNEIKEILELYTAKILDSNYVLFEEWWEKKLEQTDEEIILYSKDIWNKFKQENKDLLVSMDINIESLKQFIRRKLTSNNYTIKGKGGSIEVKCFKWKEEEPKKIEKAFENKKLVIKTEPLVYISEEVDNRIIELYNKDMLDIFDISEKENIKIYEVVSCLMKYKIIKKRDESRGYEKYKESDEYKEKVLNSKVKTK